MKLFSFFSRKTAQPAMAETTGPASPVSEAVGTFEPVADLVGLLILKVVYEFPNRGEDRNLRRFFEKTSVSPVTILQRQQALLQDGMLQLTVVKQSIQYFALTEKGKAFLDAHFDFEGMLAFAREIEPKGFIATLLHNLREKENKSL